MRLLLAVILVMFLSQAATGQWLVERSVLSGGGTETRAGRFVLRSTAGQPVAGRTQSAIRAAGIGFWHRVGSALNEVTPQSFALHQSYPNPASFAASIPFDLPRAMPAAIVVHDLLGREVLRPLDTDLSEGRHEIIIRTADLPQGVYIIELRTPEFVQLKRMVILR